MERKFIKIGELSKILNVHPQTLRRWEQLGIIKALRPYKKGVRRFDLEKTLKNLVSRN
ncbi:MAG: hypothetical protein KatS3mg095_0687 [Candidatus Parcubacteria bacterium]|nr:MAG: hypothetical protein KatS3mg095_0687 [Candidatus Parcubacteria bacterium]